MLCVSTVCSQVVVQGLSGSWSGRLRDIHVMSSFAGQGKYFLACVVSDRPVKNFLDMIMEREFNCYVPVLRAWCHHVPFVL
jgi:hypothetical protein